MPLRKIVDARKDKNSLADFMTEVRDNFNWAYTFDIPNRLLGEDDLININGEQWDAETLQQRKEDGKPVLTINKLPSYIDQVKGDARLNQFSIKVRANYPEKKNQKNNKPKELARIYNGLIRQIEQVSDADSARQTAFDGGLQNGFGFYEVIADYVDDDTFDQELRTSRIKNQFSCYPDPSHNEIDARDATFWFKTDFIKRTAFETEYPDIKPANFSLAKEGSPYERWIKQDSVRIAEYWIKRPYKRRLVSLDNGETYDADEWDKIADELKAEEKIYHVAINEEGRNIVVMGPAPEGSGFQEEILNKAPVVLREREVDSYVVVKYIVDGVQILDGPKDDNGDFILNFQTEKDLKKDGKVRKFVSPGKYIPIIPVWGKELQIGNQTYRRSLVRNAKDSQRMYNYERTAETERVALAKIPPAVLTGDQVKGYEAMWSSTKNLKYLLYNPDPKAKTVPYFPTPPQASSGTNLLSQTATQDMKDTMSIQNSSLGIQGNEKSGRAIIARQRENDIANFEFTDNLRKAVKFEGDIYVDLIPHYYDTERQLLILNEDGTEEFVTINQTIFDKQTQQEVVLNDLTQGKYLVTVTTGPNFTTQRIETAEALTSLSGSVQEPTAQLLLVTKIIKNMDWPGATETAEALEQFLPAQLRDLSDEEKQRIAQQASQQQGLDFDKLLDVAKLQGQLLKNDKTQLDIRKLERETGANIEKLQSTLDQIGPFLEEIRRLQGNE